MFFFENGENGRPFWGGRCCASKLSECQDFRCGPQGRRTKGINLRNCKTVLEHINKPPLFFVDSEKPKSSLRQKKVSNIR